MLDQWANLVLAGESSDFLVVVSFVTEKDVNLLGIAFNQGRRNLAIVFSCRRNV